MWFVYLLHSQKDQKYYVGLTADVDQRLIEHNQGNVISTQHRRPLDLIYFEAYRDKRDAAGREKFLKSGSGHRYLKKQLKHYLTDHFRGVEQSGSSSGS